MAKAGTKATKKTEETAADETTVSIRVGNGAATEPIPLGEFSRRMKHVTDKIMGANGDGPVLKVPRELIHVARCASTEKERPTLRGVNVRRRGDRMEYAATDGAMFIQVSTPVKDEPDKEPFNIEPTTIKTGDWLAGLEHMTTDKEDKMLHPNVVVIFSEDKVDIINASAETTAEIAAVPVSGSFPDANAVIPKYEVNEDVSGDADAQRKVAGRALVNPEKLAELLKAVSKMTPQTNVVIEVPLSPMEPVIVRAQGPVADSRIVGVLTPK